MKKQYLFRHENRELHPDSVIYHLWVGTSEREQKLLAQVKYEAFHNGYTLQLWDESVDMWLMVQAEQVFSSAGILNFGFTRADVTVAELRELCYSHLWESYESRLYVTQAFTRMLCEARPDLYRRHSLSDNSKSCALLRRKNLSQVQEEF